MSKKNKKKNQNLKHKGRHSFYYILLRPLVILYAKIKFGFKYKKFKSPKKENYIVLSNHVTDYDPILVGASFKKPMYFVGSEHITRWGFVYKLLKFAFNPIIRYKGTVGSSTVMEVLRRVRKGANVCIFAEGMRSWTGETNPILPSTAKLIKASKCGMVTYKLTGGYFVTPNWDEKGIRKGHIDGAPVKYYSKDELEKMSEDEIYNIITTDLYENAYETQSKHMYKYKGKNLAEKIENLIFICPKCKAHDSLHSHDDRVKCSNCDLDFRYNEFGYLEDAPYDTILDMAKWQEVEIKDNYKNNISYSADHATLSKINLDHTKTFITEGKLSFNKESLVCNDITFNTKDIIDMSLYGRHGIVFSIDNTFYEIIPDHNYSAWKFILYYQEISSHFSKDK